MPNLAFYFAWVDSADTTFDSSTHAREDEKVFSFELEHSEGDFATLTIEVRNPRVGLLKSGRKKHCFLSCSQDSQPAEPLFRGRLVAIPNNIHGEVVTLVFTARPDDFADRKETLAYSLQELPYYDPVWINIEQQEDPDVVLETRSALWHIDRISGDVTVSDLLVGEDGIVEFDDTEVPYDSVEINLQQTPIRRVQVTGTVGWQQSDSGSIPIMTNSRFDSFLADAVSKDWPDVGADLGGGWEVSYSRASSSIENIPSDAFQTSIQLHAPPRIEESSDGVVEPPPAPQPGKVGRPVPNDWFFMLISSLTRGYSGIGQATLDIQEEGILIPYVSIWLTLEARYTAARNRKETVSFTMEADTQSIITDAADSDKLFITRNGNDIGLDVGDGTFPIGDSRRRQYFTTERGLQSLEYLLLLARASLVMRSRAIEVSFQVPFERAMELSCRMNARLYDDRIPGGQALGKVTKYTLSSNGDTGEVIGSVTMGCAIGYGGTVSAAVGEETFADDYVDQGYQFHANQINVMPASDIGYTVPGGPPEDDGLSFPLRRVPWVSPPTFHPVSLSADDFPLMRLPTVVEQMKRRQLPDVVGEEFIPEEIQKLQKAVEEILKTKSCHLDFTIAPVAGDEFHYGYNITTSTLQVPMQINLEADSTP